ncbi:MAG: DUF1559 domain-containing protein [Isosphaeraceae bacterium]
MSSTGEFVTFQFEEEPLYEPPRRGRAGLWRAAGWVCSLLAAGAMMFGGLSWAGSALRQRWQDQCHARLKTIGLAFHNYHEAHGHFPAPAVRGKDGRPLLSWRVELLPFLSQQKLYDAFHKDEPWDSPHNLALLSSMPEVFACPAGHGADRHETGFVVVVGPKTELGSVNTPFEPGRGVDLREVLDGTSNTILAAERAVLVPWTKPDDPTWKRNAPPPTFGSEHPEGYHALLVDGSVRLIRPSRLTFPLFALLTINGYEVITAT